MGLKMGTDAGIRAVDCRRLPRASDEWVGDMPLVDSVAMETRTVRATVKALEMHGIILVWARRRAIRFHFVLSSCSVTGPVVAQKLSRYPKKKDQTRFKPNYYAMGMFNKNYLVI